MKIPLLCALIALASSAAVLAQDAAPAPDAPPSTYRMGGDIPPPPPGCSIRQRHLPRRPAMPDLSSDTVWRTAVGVTGAQAREVQKVIAEQAARSRQLERQHLALDASTCSKLRAIVGDKGMSRWMAAAPPPPHMDNHPMPPPPLAAPKVPNDGR